MKKLFGLLFGLLLLLPVYAGAAEITPQYDNVTINVNKEEKIVFSAETNLPDGTNVDIRLYQVSPRMELYPAAPMSYPNGLDTMTANGSLSGWFLDAYRKGINAGSYEVCLNIPGYQPHHALGKDNALLGGTGVKTVNGLKTHTACFPFSLERALFPHDENSAPAKAWGE